MHQAIRLQQDSVWQLAARWPYREIELKTIHLPDDLPLHDLIELLRKHGLRPEWIGKGVYAAVPIDRKLNGTRYKRGKK